METSGMHLYFICMKALTTEQTPIWFLSMTIFSPCLYSAYGFEIFFMFIPRVLCFQNVWTYSVADGEVLSTLSSKVLDNLPYVVGCAGKA